MKKKNKIILIAVNAILLVLIAACLLDISSLDSLLLSQQADKLWAGESEERYAQVSCFFPQFAPCSLDQIYSFRDGLSQKLIDAGIEVPENSTLWTDAFSATDSISVTGEHGKADATVFGVGGNFFTFHPYELLSGSYISDSDVMDDRVVLDYELAWNLFGSADVSGMTVEIAGKPCYVAGVVRKETDKLSKKTFSEKPLIFISYSLYSELFGGGADATDPTLSSDSITCYEIAMVEPITGYVQSAVTDSLASDDCDVVQNTGRFSFSKTLSIFTHFGERSIDIKAVAYPYWENSARVCEVYVARQYVFIALLAIFPLATLIWLIARLIKYLIPKFRKVKTEASDAWDDRYFTMDKMQKRRKAKKLTEAGEKPKKVHRRRREKIESGEDEPVAPRVKKTRGGRHIKK